MDLVQVFERLIGEARDPEEFEGLAVVAMMAGRVGLIPMSEAKRICDVIDEDLRA
jgi:hypothetical protein